MSAEQEKERDKTEKGYGVRSPREDPGAEPPMAKEERKQKSREKEEK